MSAPCTSPEFGNFGGTIGSKSSDESESVSPCAVVDTASQRSNAAGYSCRTSSRSSSSLVSWRIQVNLAEIYKQRRPEIGVVRMLRWMQQRRHGPYRSWTSSSRPLLEFGIHAAPASGSSHLNSSVKRSIVQMSVSDVSDSDVRDR